jgi:hypothetical protein
MLATYFQFMNKLIIERALDIMRQTFDGVKIELISTELERSEPNDDFPKGYLYVWVNIHGEKTQVAQQIIEDIATNPYGVLIAEEIVFPVLKDIYYKWKEDQLNTKKD